MDDKQAERVLVFGFVHALLRDPNPIQLFRVIEPPDVTLSTDLTASPAVFTGGPFLIYSDYASKITQVKSRPDFMNVTVGVLTTQQTLNNIFRITEPNSILVVRGEPPWGRTDQTLDAMKIPYNITTHAALAANPNMIFDYTLIVVDCNGWNGFIPSQIASNLRSSANSGHEIMFTDRALMDMNSTFPGYVTLTRPFPTDNVSAAYAYNPPRKYDPTKFGASADRFTPEYPSQYYNDPPRPNEIDIATSSQGFAVSSITSDRINDIRILADSNNFGSSHNQYVILAFYFEYGQGVVEGLAFHPQEQSIAAVGTNGYYATYQLYGNMFVQRNYPKLVTSLVLSKSSYVVGELVSLTMNSNLPAEYVLTIKKPDGTVWATASGVLPATFTKSATDPAGSYTAELTAHYSGAYASTSISFLVALDTYDVTISLAGLPEDATTTLQVDGTRIVDMKGSDIRVLSYPVGASHTLQVDQYVSGTAGYRYYCASNSWTASAAGSNVFNYVTQVHLDTSISLPEAGSLSLTPYSPDGWYNAGTQIQATAAVARSGYLFTRWDLDGTPVGAVQPYTIVMNAPHQFGAVFSVAGIATTETATSFSTATTTEVIQTTTTAVIIETATSETTSETTPAIETTRSQSTNSQPPEGLSPLFIASILVAVVSVVALAATGIFRLRRTHAVTPSPRICPHCGFGNPPYTSAFCVKCGNPLKASET